MVGTSKVRGRKLYKNEEIVEDISVNENIEKRKRIKTRKICKPLSNNEAKKLDKEMERNDNVSAVVIIAILVFCFIVGISLGYLLYKLAITGTI